MGEIAKDFSAADQVTKFLFKLDFNHFDGDGCELMFAQKSCLISTLIVGTAARSFNFIPHQTFEINEVVDGFST